MDILEHKVKECNIVQIMNKIAPGWCSEANYLHSNRGRILLLWDGKDVEYNLLGISSQCIHTLAAIRSLNIRFTFTVVYGLHTVEKRRSLWNELRSWHSGQQGPWISIGNYNAISSNNDGEV